MTEEEKRKVDGVEVPLRPRLSRTEALDTLLIGVSEAERPLAKTSGGLWNRAKTYYSA